MNEVADKLVKLISNEIEVINMGLDDKSFVESREKEIHGMLTAMKCILYSDPNYEYPHYFIQHGYFGNNGYEFGCYDKDGKWIHLAGVTL